jgi:hypothetical protein
MDDSLITKAMSVISAPHVVPLGCNLSSLSLPSIKIVAQTSLEVIQGPTTASVVVRKTSSMRSILQRGFLRSSSSVEAHGCLPKPVYSPPLLEVMDKGGVFNLIVPVLLLALVVRGDGEDGDFP